MSHTLSGKFAAPLHLELGPSRLMAVWLTGMHSVPLLLLPWLPLPAWLKLAIIPILLYSLLDSWRKLIRRSHPAAVRHVIWQETEHCHLMLQSGKQLDVMLASQTFILPWLVILHFRTSRRHFRYLPVLADMLDEDVFRQLRVRLRIAIDQGTQ